MVSMMELTEELNEKFDSLVRIAMKSGSIDQGLYAKYDVKRGLRDQNGKGVLTGLTEISDVVATKQEGEDIGVPIDGELYFQGVNVNDIVNDPQRQRYLFERRLISLYLDIFLIKKNMKVLSASLEASENFPVSLSGTLS